MLTCEIMSALSSDKVLASSVSLLVNGMVCETCERRLYLWKG